MTNTMIEWLSSLLSFLSLMCLYLIWLDLCSYSFRMVGGVIKPYLTLYHIILSYLTLSDPNLTYLILPYYTILYYIILRYLFINMWCDTQCCWLTDSMYYYSIIILISGWYHSSTLCCSWGSCQSCDAATFLASWHWSYEQCE